MAQKFSGAALALPHPKRLQCWQLAELHTKLKKNHSFYQCDDSENVGKRTCTITEEEIVLSIAMTLICVPSFEAVKT